MKRIVLLTAAAASVLLLSCERRQFIPDTGSTPVQFEASEIEVELVNQYLRIPIYKTDVSYTASKAVVEFTGGNLYYNSGASKPIVEFTDNYEEGGDILITSKEIYVPANDPNDNRDTLPRSANLEVLIPDYRSYAEIELNFELTGEYLGENTAVKVTVTPFQGIIYEGSIMLPNEKDGAYYTVTIEQDEEISNRYWFINLEGTGTIIRSLYGELDIDGVTMRIPIEQHSLASGLENYKLGAVGSEGNLLPGEVPVLTFSPNGVSFNNGFFFGQETSEGWSVTTVVNPGSSSPVEPLP